MGTPFDSSSEDPKKNIVMGYPSIDRYHQAQNIYPQVPNGNTVPYPPQGYPQSTFQNQPRYVSTTPSFQQSPGYGSSPLPYPQGKFASPASQNPYSPSYNEFNYYQQPVKPLMPETSDTTSFGRVMLIMLIILVGIMCMMSLIMWSLFGTYVPEFEVQSFKVTGFNATDNTLTAYWDSSVLARNANDEPLHFDHVRSSIFYKEVMLGFTQLQDFDLEKKQNAEVNHRVMAQVPPSNGEKLPDWLLPSLSKDQSKGVVIFSLRLAMSTNYSAPRLMNRQDNLRIMCENLVVKDSGNGEWNIPNGTRVSCLIRKTDKAD